MIEGWQLWNITQLGIIFFFSLIIARALLFTNHIENFYDKLFKKQ